MKLGTRVRVTALVQAGGDKDGPEDVEGGDDVSNFWIDCGGRANGIF